MSIEESLKGKQNSLSASSVCKVHIYGSEYSFSMFEGSTFCSQSLVVLLQWGKSQLEQYRCFVMPCSTYSHAVWSVVLTLFILMQVSCLRMGSFRILLLWVRLDLYLQRDNRSSKLFFQ